MAGLGNQGNRATNIPHPAHQTEQTTAQRESRLDGEPNAIVLNLITNPIRADPQFNSNLGRSTVSNGISGQFLSRSDEQLPNPPTDLNIVSGEDFKI